jgi:hypothetical protein
MTGLAAQLAYALDPGQMACALGIEPDPWQLALLRSTSKRLLLNCSRQSGKSTVVALMALWQALYAPGSLILVLAPGLRQSSELFKKLVSAYDRLGRPVAAAAQTALSLQLRNNSRVVALPGLEARVRGFSGASLIAVDEASRVDDALYRSIRPVLSVSGGKLALLSTPWGRRGFFYEEWERREQWDYYEVPATSCPRIPAAFLAEEARVLGHWWYGQEYCCTFSDTTDQVFSYDVVRAALSDDITPIFTGGTGGRPDSSTVA